MAGPAMVYTMEQYYSDNAFYDYRLISTLGFEDEDVDYIKDHTDAAAVEGAISFDAIVEKEKGEEIAIKAHSVTNDIDKLVLMTGRMPKSANECVVDDLRFKTEDIGKILTITETTSDENHFLYEDYKIVGLVRSPLYTQYERGNTSLGDGVIDAFVYMTKDAFDVDYYTEVYAKFSEDYHIYSDEYDEALEAAEDTYQRALDEAAINRYDRIMESAKEEVRDALIEQGIPESYIDDDMINEALPEVEEPSTYLLGRDTNIGYVCFESDSSIVDGIANVFPVFFFLVAALVCMTTMNRMVEDHRTQLGVLKALGYSNLSILSTYIMYSGSAALVGAVIGYFGGCTIFPKAIWYAYCMMYSTRDLILVYEPVFAIVVLSLTVICTVGVTVVSCNVELKEVAAQLMRPKAPTAGKRILLERIGFIWNHLKFLQKVSIRNIFRYKKRLYMMLLGISGCSALLVTGFGLRDSISNVANTQFEKYSLYDMKVTFSKEIKDADSGDTMYFMETSMTAMSEAGNKDIYIDVFDSGANLRAFYNLADEDGNQIDFPNTGEIVLNENVAKKLELKVGDEITLRNTNMESASFVISGLNQNYIYDYGYISEESYEQGFGKSVEKKSAYINTNKDVHDEAAALLADSKVSAVSVSVDLLDRVDSMMRSMNIIVLLVIICAASLAFVVLYNLTSININERIREIATIKVLGFYKNEAASYVFKENILMTIMGAAIGLVLGKYLHAFVMSQIVVDLITFSNRVEPISYVYSFALTILFTIFVNAFMGRKLDQVSMTESLKSVD